MKCDIMQNVFTFPRDFYMNFTLGESCISDSNKACQ